MTKNEKTVQTVLVSLLGIEVIVLALAAPKVLFLLVCAATAIWILTKERN